MAKKIKHIITTILVTGICSTMLIAQSRPDNSRRQPRQQRQSQQRSPRTQSDPGGNPDVPIDGGIVLLAAAGAAYGVKKIRDAQKKRKQGI